MRDNSFKFIPSPYEGGQITDSKPGEKFEDKFDPIFECIQNTIDAKKNDKEKVSLKIHFQKVYKKDLYFLNKNFISHLKNSKRVSDKYALDEETVDLLILEDFSTTGITGEPETMKDQTTTGKPNNFFNMNYSFGDNQKLDDFRLGGSEGEGRQTYCLTSGISTFFYYNVDSSNQNQGSFFGISYLGKREIGAQIFQPFAYFGKEKEKENRKEPVYDAVPIDDNDEIQKLIKIFKLKRKVGESGLSIIIPHYLKELKDKELLISKIIDVYRMSILRNKLEVTVEDTLIDSSNILEIYLNGLNPDNNNKFKTEQKELLKEYFSFLKEIDNKKFENLNEINYLGERTISKDQIINYEDLSKSYNRQEINKIRFNFSIKRINPKSDKVSNRYNEFFTYLDFYFKKYPSWASVMEKNNDFIRGPMSLRKLRKKNMQMFWMIDVQDEYASLLIKNSEHANHSTISAMNKKLETNYKGFYNLIVNIKKLPQVIYNFLTNEENITDNEITQDLFKIEDDGSGIRETDKISDDYDEDDDGVNDEKAKSIFGVNDIVVPPIFESLRYYDRDSETKNEKIFYSVKGKKYNQKDILNLLSEAEKYVEITQKIEREKYSDLELLRMDTKVATIKRRIIEYKDFIAAGYTYYPRRIEIEAAYDGEDINNPFRKYSIDDFDFSDETFSFKCTGDAKIKYNENKITIFANSENFSFLVSGFGEDQSEDIKWRDRSYSIDGSDIN